MRQGPLSGHMFSIAWFTSFAPLLGVVELVDSIKSILQYLYFIVNGVSWNSKWFEHIISAYLLAHHNQL
jgi:hypothetical protein